MILILDEEMRVKISSLISFSDDDVTRMIKANNYYDRYRNSNGLGIENKFEHQPGDSVVYDAETGLTWQRSGSSKLMLFKQAQAYIEQKKRENYGGFSDWRLPTLKEAMSLMSPRKDGVSIDPLFDKTQRYIWTSDKESASIAWYVDFNNGNCNVTHVIDNYIYVRAVR